MLYEREVKPYKLDTRSLALAIKNCKVNREVKGIEKHKVALISFKRLRTGDISVGIEYEIMNDKDLLTEKHYTVVDTEQRALAFFVGYGVYDVVWLKEES